MVRVDVDSVDAEMGLIHTVCAVDDQFVWRKRLDEGADLGRPLIRHPHIPKVGAAEFVAGLVSEDCRVLGI